MRWAWVLNSVKAQSKSVIKGVALGEILSESLNELESFGHRARVGQRQSGSWGCITLREDGIAGSHRALRAKAVNGNGSVSF